MKKIPKMYIAIAVILVIYLAGIFLFQYSTKKSNKETIMMMGTDTKLLYKNGEWNSFPTYTTDYDWKKFDIYENGFLKDKYMIENREGNIHYYDNGYVNLGVLTDDFIAIKSDENYHVIAKNESTIDNENTFVKQVLSDNHINNIENVRNYKVLSADLNQDGKEDNIYYISNLFLGKGDKFFSIVFSVINDKIVYITRYVENNIYAGTDIEARPTIHDGVLQLIFNIDGTKNFDIFINNSYYGRSESCTEIYRYQTGKFNKLMSCKEESQ